MTDRRITAAGKLLGDALARSAATSKAAASGSVPAKWGWGTVASQSPLTVLRDQDTTPVPATSIGFTPTVGVRVRTALVAGRVIMLAAGDNRQVAASTSSVLTLTKSGWSIAANSGVITRGGLAKLYLTLTATATVSVPADGNLANIQLGTVPTSYRPLLSTEALAAATTGPVAAGFVDTSGAVFLAAIAPGAVVASGYSVQLLSGWYPCVGN